jgi:hypothetical protein
VPQDYKKMCRRINFVAATRYKSSGAAAGFCCAAELLNMCRRITKKCAAGLQIQRSCIQIITKKAGYLLKDNLLAYFFF